MIALIRKEWRESRALMIGFLILTPLLSLALKHFLLGWDRVHAVQSGLFVLPGMLLLFVMAIGSDLIAGDAASGRIRFLAALPVRSGTLWAAKVVFLVGAPIIYLGYAFLVEWTILKTAVLETGLLFGAESLQLLVAWVGVALVAAGTLFYSTLIDRGFAAVFAALVTLAAIVAPGWAIDWEGLGFRGISAGLLLGAGALVAAGFLLGSFLAFTRGRIHLGARLRRVVYAAAGFLLVTVPPAAHSAVRIADWRDVRPDSPELRVYGHRTVSADGRWVFVSAGRGGEGPLGVRPPSMHYAVSLKDGRVRDLTGLGHPDRSARAGPDRVVLWRTERVPDEEKEIYLRVVYDLAEGRVLQTRTVVPERLPRRPNRWGPLAWKYENRRMVLLPEGSPPIELEQHWRLCATPRSWVALTGRSRGSYELVLLPTGERRAFPSPPEDGIWSSVILPPTPDGAALAWVARGPVRKRGLTLYRIPVSGGEPEVVGRCRGASWGLAPNGRWGVALGGGTAWFCRDDGAAWSASAPSPGKGSWIRWSADSRHFAYRAEDGYRLGDAEGGLRRLPLETGLGEVCWTDGKRLLLNRRDALYLATTEGEVRRLLPTGGE